MKVQSTRFGEIDFPEEALLEFPEGILGFPEQVRYLLLEHDKDDSPFKWLQSADAPELAFIVIDPLLIVPSYTLMIDSDTAKMIQHDDPAECACMTIVNVPEGDAMKMTANLKAPIVVNPEQRLGRQIIMGSQAFSINEPVFPRLNERMAVLEASDQADEPHAATA